MKELKNDKIPKNIYVIINENRNGFKNKILKAFNIDVENTENHLTTYHPLAIIQRLSIIQLMLFPRNFI